ncbi:hypothetical protein Gogos_016965 [Gossypium gossypioides]|uniref:Uncharacterized protein n=1 Tax=Gossypium gossypioides TaxID=34282 RepID=A0A7J9BBD0_GOSGO|nr:hypothetical protein [Gossypium gossypioides]
MEEEMMNLNIAEDKKEPVQALGDKDVVEESVTSAGGSIQHGYWGKASPVLIFQYDRSEEGDGWNALIGNFIGQFLEYDVALITKGVRKFMRIRVKLDVPVPLGHGEGFCPVRLTLGAQEVVFGWDSSLRAAPQRAVPVASCWLREDPGDGVG